MLVVEDVVFTSASINYEFCYKSDETIHLCAAGYGASSALVLSAGHPLPLRLPFPRLPILSYGL
jgi:hypothetical protein